MLLKQYVRFKVWLAKVQEKLKNNENGAISIEYIVIAAFVVLALAGAFFAAGPKLRDWLNETIDKIMRGGA